MAENVGGISASVELEEGSLDAQLARIRQSMQTTAQQIQQVNVQFAGGAMSVETYVSKIEVLQRAQGVLTSQSRALEQQIRATNAAAAAAATGSSSFAVGLGGAADSTSKMTINSAALTRGIVDLSRGFEDFTTGGFLGILNNLPGMTANIAMGFGVAAEKALAMGTAVSVIATASFALYKNWGQVQSLLGTGLDIPALKGLEALEDRLKTLNKRIEELRGKGKLSLAESFELREATEERATVKRGIEDTKQLERVTGDPAAAEKARGEAFAKAVAESGGKNALGQLELYLEKLADERGRVGVLGAETGTAGQVARELFVNASRGDEAALGSIMKALPADNAFRERIRTESPEYKAFQEAEDAGEKAAHERGVAQAKRDREYQEAIAEGAKEEAEENQKHFEKEMKRKIDSREALTAGEMEALPPELRNRQDDLEEREMTQRSKLSEQIHDNQYRIFQALNPTREGQRMSLDQYESSIKSQTGETLEAKRLHTLIELQKQQVDLLRKRAAVGAVKRRA